MRALLLIALLIPVSAAGHEVTHPKQLDLHLDPTGITVLVHFNRAAGSKARDTRGDFDANHDGQLTEVEARALVRRLTTFATHALRVSSMDEPVAGTPPELLGQHGLKAPVNSATSLGITLKIRYKIAFSAQPRIVTIQDRHPDPKWNVMVRIHSREITVTPEEPSEVNGERPLALLVALAR